MRKIKNFSVHIKIISAEQPQSKNNNKKKLTKEIQEFLQTIAASGFKTFSKKQLNIF